MSCSLLKLFPLFDVTGCSFCQFWHYNLASAELVLSGTLDHSSYTYTWIYKEYFASQSSVNCKFPNTSRVTTFHANDPLGNDSNKFSCFTPLLAEGEGRKIGREPSGEMVSLFFMRQVNLVQSENRLTRVTLF